jgi:hypothetical protein
MTRAGEIVRVGRGRYGPRRRSAAPPDAALDEAMLRDEDRHFFDLAREATPRFDRAVDFPHPPHDVAKPVAPIPAAPSSGANARELAERRFGIREDAKVEAPRPSMDLGTFCATISAMYTKAGLCPPFRLRNFAAAWFASGIEPQHCLAVVESHLREHAASCQSGSADRLLAHLDGMIRRQWDQRWDQRAGKGIAGDLRLEGVDEHWGEQARAASSGPSIASTAPELVQTGSKTMAVIRIRITNAGRQVLAEPRCTRGIV